MKFFLSLLILTSFANDLPFWKKKQAVYEQIKEQREIIVSAKIISEKNEKRLDIISAGHIQAPLDFTWQKLLDFENYHKISDHFKDIRYDKNKQELYLNVGALGYYAQLWLRLTPSTDPTKKTLNWFCTKGAFQGMRGTILTEKISTKITEISMNANFSGKSIPIPDILIRFGLELIGKQMATKMRNYIEDSYKNDTSTN